MALAQKNHVIHALQLKWSEISDEREEATSIASSSATATSISPSQSELSCRVAADLEEVKDLEILHLKTQLAAMTEQLSEARRTAEEQAATVAELAHMLACQTTLVESVQAFVQASQQMSLPSTPREPIVTTNNTNNNGVGSGLLTAFCQASALKVKEEEEKEEEEQDSDVDDQLEMTNSSDENIDDDDAVLTPLAEKKRIQELTEAGVALEFAPVTPI